MKLIQISNSVAQTIAPQGFTNLGSVTRKVGCNSCCPTFNYNGSTSITIAQPGYYQVSVSADIEAAVAGQQVFSLVQDGITLTDLSTTLAAVGDIQTTSRSVIVRVFCNDSTTLALQNTAAIDSTLNNVIFDVVKID